MPRVATMVPAETDLLCEGCGYTLNGLPESSNCPECGKPIGESVGLHRQPSGYEVSPSAGTFWGTTWQVLFSPRAFFVNLATRSDIAIASSFAKRHRITASILFGLTATGHLEWALLGNTGLPANDSDLARWLLCGVLAPLFVFLMLTGVTKLATWLSAIEAKYWGMRLPHAVVRRGMQFHSANYLPVGIVAFSIVWGYRLALFSEIVSRRYDDIYLYTLCGVVILSALYLFQAYWIAMRSMMFANR